MVILLAIDYRAKQAFTILLLDQFFLVLKAYTNSLNVPVLVVNERIHLFEYHILILVSDNDHKLRVILHIFSHLPLLVKVMFDLLVERESVCHVEDQLD
jgi:hypothetical protein